MNNRREESRRTIDRAIDSCFEHISDDIIILDFDLKPIYISDSALQISQCDNPPIILRSL